MLLTDALAPTKLRTPRSRRIKASCFCSARRDVSTGSQIDLSRLRELLKGRPPALDWNATTPLRPEVRQAMAAALELCGNPSSVHAEGRCTAACDFDD
jgi:hypothetical protein